MPERATELTLRMGGNASYQFRVEGDPEEVQQTWGQRIMDPKVYWLTFHEEGKSTVMVALNKVEAFEFREWEGA